MSPLQICILINYILCLFVILDMIFIRKKKVERILAWIIFLIIPFVGLFIYLVLGSGLDGFNKHNIKKLMVASREYNKDVESSSCILNCENCQVLNQIGQTLFDIFSFIIFIMLVLPLPQSPCIEIVIGVSQLTIKLHKPST